MEVRVFLPSEPPLEPFPYGDFAFDTMPQEGNILQFADLPGANYPVEQVGFIQEGKSFIGAVWLGEPRKVDLQSAGAIEGEEVEAP